MTTTVDELALRREAESIAARRADAIAAHPATVSKQLPPGALVAAVARTLGQVERQQMLGALIAALGDDRLDLTSDTDLPMIVGLLLVSAPQAVGQPRLVAKAVEEAAAAHRASVAPGAVFADDLRRRQDLADDAAFLTSQLAAGTALTTAYGHLGDAQQLCDWLTAAAQR